MQRQAKASNFSTEHLSLDNYVQMQQAKLLKKKDIFTHHYNEQAKKKCYAT